MSRSVPHPDLHLARLDALSLRARIIARRVCVRDCPRDATDAFKGFLRDLPADSPDVNYLLPALFFLLDPSNVPTAGEIELANLEAVINDFATYIQFTLAKVDPYPTPAYTAMWLRLFPWIDFFDTYRSALPAACTRPLGRTFARLYLVNGVEADATDLKGLRLPTIWTQPRFSYVVGKEMAAMFDRIGDSSVVEQASMVHTAFFASKSGDAYNIDIYSFLDGATGGSAQQWAATLTNSFRRTVRAVAGRRLINAEAIMLITTIIGTAHDTLSLLKDSEEGNLPVVGDFVRGLLDTKCVDPLTQAVGILALPGHPHEAREIEPTRQEAQFQVLVLLRMLLDVHLRYVPLLSVSHGLLSALGATAGLNLLADAEEIVRYIITGVLQPALTNPQIVSALAQDTSDSAQRLNQYQQSILRPQFDVLIAGIERQSLRVPRWMVKAERPGRVCDGFHCIVVGEKRTFRQCTGCNYRLYCSVPCQHSDWTTGNHRNMCRAYLSLSTGLASLTLASTRSFLRFMMNEEYVRDHAGSAGSPPNIAMFDYRGESGNTVRYLDSLTTSRAVTVSSPGLSGFYEALEADYVQRAARDAEVGVGWNICILRRMGSDSDSDGAFTFVHRILRKR
ncbi:hypothetical protein MIND_01355700 [Mycena indigotica]|uniref:MYND-type domain-containing protein n=1 Tax=Mycena indigotica TaxID=2126181 RepID=A0A8H6VQB9_9AGAR|nr:uncharacterized protein MIND_01355700 [Mycena indigotica]KAF7289814.1 hypothetical protein MIND_01355700 [Mycena indigotica]